MNQPLLQPSVNVTITSEPWTDESVREWLGMAFEWAKSGDLDPATSDPATSGSVLLDKSDLMDNHRHVCAIIDAMAAGSEKATRESMHDRTNILTLYGYLYWRLYLL